MLWLQCSGHISRTIAVAAVQQPSFFRNGNVTVAAALWLQGRAAADAALWPISAIWLCGCSGVARYV